jgi:hypothetical protein
VCGSGKWRLARRERVPLLQVRARVRPLPPSRWRVIVDKTGARVAGGASRCPGALRRADECDPIRVEDGEDEDANMAPGRWREKGCDVWEFECRDDVACLTNKTRTRE